jgi:hypothetical protein
MKITESRLREIIKEEILWEARQAALREGLLDAIKSAIGMNKGEGSSDKPSVAFSAVSKLFEELSDEVSSDISKIKSSTPASKSEGDVQDIAISLLGTFVTGGVGSMSQLQKDFEFLANAYASVSKTIEKDPEGTKRSLMRNVQSTLGKSSAREDFDVEKNTSINPSRGFAEIGKILSNLSTTTSSSVNKLQSSLPATDDFSGGVGIANATVNGFISGGLGSLSQFSKDLGLLGKAFESAAKLVEKDPESAKEVLQKANSNLGKATSGG